MEAAVAQFKDLVSSTSLAVSPGGGLAFLAGRRCYALVSLPSLTLQYKEARASKWDVVCSEWAGDGQQLAVAANNRVDLLEWARGELEPAATLPSQTRALTDISWCRADPQLLATSSSSLCVWDRRDPRRPQLSLRAVAAASSVQWNKVSSRLLASAHEGEVKLWDVRAGNCPLQSVSVQLSRIHCLDWSPDQENCLAVSSSEAVQLWNVSAPAKPEQTLKVGGVWRLGHTPAGCGLLTLATQTLLRAENSLVLWSLQDLRAPVHTFQPGSAATTDTVLEFGWTAPQGRTQLVTWSKDCSLRLWELDSECQRRCGLDPVEEAPELAGETETGMVEGQRLRAAPAVVVSEEAGAVILSSTDLNLPAIASSHPPVKPATKEETLPPTGQPGSVPAAKKSMNLNYEFTLLNISDKLEVVSQDAKERLFTVSTETAKNVLILHVKFPLNYPNQKAPTFSFLQGTTVDSVTSSAILGKLRVVAKQQISRNRRCLEPCLRQFEASVEQLVEQEEEQIKINNPTGLSGGYQDFNIPFPRSSGARFCGDGALVCFGCPRQYSVPVERAAGAEVGKTPRALSASSQAHVVGLCRSPSQDSTLFPYQARVPRVRFSQQKVRSVSVSSATEPERKKENSRANLCTVTVYSCTSLLPFSKELALQYRLPSSTTTAESLQRILAHNARAAGQAERPDLAQVWTLLGLTVSGLQLPSSPGRPPWQLHPLGRGLLHDFIQHFINTRDVQSVALLCATVMHPAADTPPGPALLDPAMTDLYDSFILTYADLLYRWQFFSARTELVKRLSAGRESDSHLTSVSCTSCRQPLLPGPATARPLCCASLSRCSVCRLPCPRLTVLCPRCGHGGHASHLANWFSQHSQCPACPCHCTAPPS